MSSRHRKVLKTPTDYKNAQKVFKIWKSCKNVFKMPKSFKRYSSYKRHERSEALKNLLIKDLSCLLAIEEI